MPETTTEAAIPSGSWKVSAAISLVILAIAGGLVFLTFNTEPSAEKGGATKRTAMLVDVIGVERGNYRPQIVAQGTVEPAQDIVLRPQVDGRVTSLGSSFTPGGYVNKGDLLVRIEGADYRHALAQRKSELRQAESELVLEKGRQDAAKAEYQHFDESLSAENEALVLRKPQLDAAKERVNAAEAAVEQAKLNLRRTSVRAPFDAHIIRRDANVGSQLSTNDSIGRLVGIDTYWVGVELPLPKLRWVTVAARSDDDKGSTVRVRNRKAWPEDAYRQGHLFKLVGALDEETRMARVLAEIRDPLARDEGNEDKPPMIIGEFVEVSIEGNEVTDAVRLDRDYVRKDETVWLMNDGKLKVADVDIAVRDAEYAYITGGLEDGARVVTTNLSTVVEGAPLRLEGGKQGDDSE